MVDQFGHGQCVFANIIRPHSPRNPLQSFLWTASSFLVEMPLSHHRQSAQIASHSSNVRLPLCFYVVSSMIKLVFSSYCGSYFIDGAPFDASISRIAK